MKSYLGAILGFVAFGAAGFFGATFFFGGGFAGDVSDIEAEGSWSQPSSTGSEDIHKSTLFCHREVGNTHLRAYFPLSRFSLVAS